MADRATDSGSKQPETTSLGDFSSSALFSDAFETHGSRQQTPGSLIGDGVQASLYTAQTMANGLLQNVNHLGAGHLVNEIKIIAPPESADTLDHVAEVVGSGVAVGLTYFATRGVLGRLGPKLLESAAALKLSPSVMTRASDIQGQASDFLTSHPVTASAAKNFVAGSIYTGLTTNVETNSDKDFWQQRQLDAALGGLTMAMLGSTATGIKEAGRSFNLSGSSTLGAVMKDNLVANTAAGVVAGAVGAESSAIVKDGRLASKEEVTSESLELGLAGLAMGAVSKPFEPNFVKVPVESNRMAASGSLQARLDEGVAIQREANKYGEPLSYALPQIAGRGDVRLLTVGEQHLALESQLRDEIAKALPGMNKNGVTMMAEELPPGAQPYIDSYMATGQFGFPTHGMDPDANILRVFSRNTSFMNEMEAARKLSMKVYAVARPFGSSASSDDVMANNVSNILRENPGQKMIWTGGNFHAEYGASATGGNETFASQLRRTDRFSGQIVSFGSMTNSTGTLDNLSTTLNYLNEPIVIPTQAAKTIAALPSYNREIDGRTPTIGQWDYVTLLPRKVKGIGEAAP